MNPMALLAEKPWYAKANSQRIVILSFVAIAIIAAADSVLLPYLALEFLYLLPLAAAAAFLSTWQILVVSAICAAFANGFANLPQETPALIRTCVIFVVYVFVALVVNRLAVYGRSAGRRVQELEREVAELHASDTESQSLINSSALAIVTVSDDGKILRCNVAAHDILGVGYGGLTGRPITDFSIRQLPGAGDDSPAQSTCKTAAGEPFEARIWSSAFAVDGRRIRAVFIEPVGLGVARSQRVSSERTSR